MKHYLRILIAYLFILSAHAQQVTKDDYKRAVSFIQDNYNDKTAFNLFTSVNWFEDNSGVWFIDYSKGNKRYKTVDFKKGKVVDLFNHEKLANSLVKLSNIELKPNELVLSNFQRIDKGFSFKFNETTYLCDLKTYDLKLKKEKKQIEENSFEKKSPDGKWIAYTENYNLFIKSTETNKSHQLSFNGEKDYEYATYYDWFDILEGENAKRPKHFSVNWSNDSKWLSTKVIDFRNAEKMYLLDHSIDSLYKSKLLSYYRGSPGDTTMVKTTPVFYNIDTKQEVKTNLPTGTHINSVSLRWTEGSGIVNAEYSERGYLKKYVKEVDLNSNTEKVLIEEISDTGIDYFKYYVLKGKQKIIFLSEKTGWRQLHILDLKTNKTKLLTSDNYYINSIEFIDHENEIIYFLASGKELENNPYHQQLYNIDFNGKETLLTSENTHHIVSFSEKGDYFVDNYSTITIPTKTVLRISKSGKIITKLTEADVSQAKALGWTSPKPFSLKAKDKKTTIYGAYWKPTNFDRTKSYPIIDATYTGPHTQVFPKNFSKAFRNQSLAELGFIVVQIDGLGTSGRSKKFHDHSYKNMENNLEDHVLAIKYLGEEYSWIDTKRVGIFGRSAGGYDAGRGMLGFSDFYKVGIATSADHDFRMEKAWWPEMYQGWPVDETYEQISNISNAKNLKGKLLLIHGGIDDNVNPSATFKLAEALINADKEFDLLILPSQRHSSQGKYARYITKKQWNYFVEHLGGNTPIWDFKWE